MTILELIKNLKLEQNRVVDLTQISSEEHYYSDFNSALSDVNNGIYSDNTTEDNAVIATFGTEDIFVIRLLEDIDLEDANITFDNNIILDLNGHTLKLGNGKMTLSEDSGQATENNVAIAENDWSFLFYGMEKGSCVSVNRTIDIKYVFESFYGSRFTGMIGGNYSYSLINETETLSMNMISYKLFGMTNIICNCNFTDNDIRTQTRETGSRVGRRIIQITNDAYIKNSDITLDIQNADDKDRMTGMCVYCTNYDTSECKNLTVENCNITLYDVNSNPSHSALCVSNYKTKIINSNIQQIDVKGTWYAHATEYARGVRFTGTNHNNRTYIENSFIYGAFAGVTADDGKHYVVNSKLVGTSHGGYYCMGRDTDEDTPSGIFYFKNCEFDCVRDNTPEGKIDYSYSLGSIFVGYGAIVYADNCTFNTWRETTIAFNQRTGSLRSSTMYLSNCECKKNIRSSSTIDPTDKPEVKYSTLVIGKNNKIPNQEALKASSGQTDRKIYVIEQPDGYYGDRPEFVKDLNDSTARYLEKLDIERFNLYNICEELKCIDTRNTRLNGLINALDNFSTSDLLYNPGKLKLLTESKYMNTNISGTILTANDVSPIEHSVGCFVSSKNIIDPYAYNKSESVGVDIGSDGVINVKPVNNEAEGNLENGIVVYDIDLVAMGIEGRICLNFEFDNGAEGLGNYSTFALYKDGQLLSNVTPSVVGDIGTLSGSLKNAKTLRIEYAPFPREMGWIKIQIEKLEEGSPTSFTPYMTDFSGVEVKRYEGNLIDDGKKHFSSKNIFFGTSNVYKSHTLLPAGTYTLSAKVRDGLRINLYALEFSGTVTLTTLKYTDKNSLTFTLSKPTLCNFKVYHEDYTSVDDLEWAMLEVGDTATPSYKPYITPTTYQSNADGIVDGITSVSPNMTLISNNDDVVINANYLRDIDTYIDNLITNVALTGGE